MSPADEMNLAIWLACIAGLVVFLLALVFLGRDGDEPETRNRVRVQPLPEMPGPLTSPLIQGAEGADEEYDHWVAAGIRRPPYDAVTEFDANWQGRPTYVTGDRVIVTTALGTRHRGIVTGIGLPVTACRRFKVGDPEAGEHGWCEVHVPDISRRPMPYHESELKPHRADEMTPTITDLNAIRRQSWPRS